MGFLLIEIQMEIEIEIISAFSKYFICIFFIYSEKLLLGLKFGFNIHKSSTLTFSCFTISLFTS